LPSLQKKVAENIFVDEALGKQAKYEALLPQIIALTKGESDMIANVANVIAALRTTFNFFWIGIYFVKKEQAEELVLGPFQGPVACTRIARSRGVCGHAWDLAKTIIVPDVSKFQDHISCNSLSKSEIVIPVIKNKKVVAVMDIDSDELNSFDQDDKFYLEKISDHLAGII
jgi:L-methionine (R)-S-oxide reductase